MATEGPRIDWGATLCRWAQDCRETQRHRIDSAMRWLAQQDEQTLTAICLRLAPLPPRKGSTEYKQTLLEHLRSWVEGRT